MYTLGVALSRYGLVAILLYFGAFKFTAVEAQAIQPLVGNHPLMSWLYQVTSVQGVSSLIGGTEILIALLIASRAIRPRWSAAGSLGAIVMFLTTLSFLVTTPGIWERVPGFPVPVPGGAGGFILKDLFLLAAAVSTAAEARTAPG
jgi:uncharacterized membrane protein YkgB